MKALKAFVAGFIAVLVFHQGMLALLYATGVTDRAPYSMKPTHPFGVPTVFSLAFWGGVWGLVLLAAVAKTQKTSSFWIIAMLVGTLATTLVAALVVLPLKGQPLAGVGKPQLILMGLLVNGAWAFGTALLFRWLRVKPRQVSGGPDQH